MGLCTGRLVAGSVWRLAGLMQGRCTAWKTWPDGRPATALIRMQKVIASEEQLVADLSRAELSELSKADLKERGAGEILG